MPLYTWLCSCGLRFDALGARDASSRPCPECSRNATREQVYAVNATGFAITPPGAMDLSQDCRRFQEATAELDYRHTRLENAAGKPLPPPPLYRTAKTKAAKWIKQGAKRSADIPELNRK